MTCLAPGRLLLPVLFALVLCGCRGESDLVPVSGKVINDKTLLDRGTIAFHPDASKGNKSEKTPRAEIDKNGTYTLYTDGTPGAPAGWYKVTVVAQKTPVSEDPMGEADYAPPDLLVAEMYTEAEFTPLLIEVKPDAPAGHYDIKLAPRR